MSGRETLEHALEEIHGVKPEPPDSDASDMWDSVMSSLETDIDELLVLLDVWEVLRAGRKPIRRAVSDDGEVLVMYLDSAGRVIETKKIEEGERCSGSRCR